MAHAGQGKRSPAHVARIEILQRIGRGVQGVDLGVQGYPPLPSQ
jgi:hypothetical protein